jgi:phage tail sheath gpL-like
MAISFRNIPGNLRVPLAYFEMDNSMANTGQQDLQRALLLGSVPAGAGLAPNTIRLVSSADEVRQLVGVGSALGRQAQRWFQNTRSVPLYILAALEPGAWTFSTGAIVWTGPATDGGTISLYIGGRLCRVPIGRGDTAVDIAAAVADAITDDPTLGVEAAVDATDDDTTNITALQAGISGRLSIAFNLEGAIGGEEMPPGVAGAITAMSAASGNPNVATLLAGVGDASFDFVMSPWTVLGTTGTAPFPVLPPAADLAALDDFFNDTTGRWSWAQQLYGHGFTAGMGTVGQLSNFGNTRNGQHVSLMGYANSPTPPDEWLTAYVAQSGGSLIIDPARPVQALPMIGIKAPPMDDRFTILERQVLYFDGISSYEAGDDGTVYINRVITTYRRNQWGAPDNSYLDVETMFTAQYFNRFMRNRVSSKFPRHKLANDGTRFGAGQAIVTPAIIWAEMVAAYGELEELGLMENMAGFEENLIVERNAQDPNRVDVLLPPDFVNQLRVFAALTQFRLQG